MPYELAKELKDAGYRQQPTINLSYYDGEDAFGVYSLIGVQVGEGGDRVLNLDDYRRYSQEPDKYELTKVPTLSELIEACRTIPKGESDNRYGLILESELFDKDGQIEERWRAYFKRGVDFPDFDASTPEEAVARLWLALNKHA